VSSPYVFPNRPVFQNRFDAAIGPALAEAMELGIGAYYVGAADIYEIGLVDRVTCGWLFRPGSLWPRAHYSKQNRRWCINLLPMVTLWICLKGGRRP
jgi:hypothetical protein